MANTETDQAKSEHESYAHIAPLWVLLTVFAVLMFLTFVTVAATWVNLGGWNLGIAMAIATVKAILVALYFMHLRYDHPFNALLFAAALLFLALFISLTLLDTIKYQPDVTNWGQTSSSQAPR